MKKPFKYPTKFRKECVRLVEKYTRMAKLDYRGSVIYMDIDEEGDQPDMKVSADCIINESYFSADIRIYPNALKRWKKDTETLNEVISHEVAHILTEPLYLLLFQTYKGKEEVERIREQSTEKIARIMQKVKCST